MSSDQAYAMRMARATEQDIEAVNGFWETICGWAESEDRVDADSIQQAIDAVEGSFNRVFWGYQVLHDNACDKSLSYLDYKPEIKGLEQQRDQLLAACEKLVDYRRRVGPLNFQLEKADDYIRMIETAIAAATGEVSQ